MLQESSQQFVSGASEVDCRRELCGLRNALKESAVPFWLIIERLMPIITVSRGSMSGGKALAECLSRALGSPGVGREILIDATAKLGVPEPLLAKKMEKAPDCGTSSRGSHVYLVAVQPALADHAEKGDLVYHCLAGHPLLRDVSGMLSIRLIVPLEMRIGAVMAREGLTRETAEHCIRKVDEDRIRLTRFMYGVDLQDPQL